MFCGKCGFALPKTPLKKKPLNLWQITKDSFRLYRKNFILFFMMSMPAMACWFLSEALKKGNENNLFAVLARIILVLIATWVSNAIIIAVSRKLKKQDAGFTDSLELAGGSFWRYLVFALMYGLISDIGFLLLVLPGIYWGMTYFFVPAASVLEKDEISPFAMSRELTEGFFWELLAYVVICCGSFVAVFEGCIFFPAMLPFKNFALSLLLMALFCVSAIPFFAIAYVVLYESLKKLKKKQLSGKSAKTRLAGVNTGGGCLINIGLLVVLTILAYCTVTIVKEVFHYDLGKNRESVKSRGKVLTAPSGLRASRGQNMVSLSWNEAPPTEYISGYAVYMRRDTEKEFAIIATGIKNNYFTAMGLLNGREYDFKVAAISGEDNYTMSAYSNEAAGVPVASKNTIDGAIRIKWGKDPTENIAGYNIYISEESGKGYAKVNRAPANGSGYTVTGLDVGVKYYFVLTTVTKDSPPIESKFSKEFSETAQVASKIENTP